MPKSVRPTRLSGQAVRKRLSDFFKQEPTYLSGFRKRGAEKCARATGAPGQSTIKWLNIIMVKQ